MRAGRRGGRPEDRSAGGKGWCCLGRGVWIGRSIVGEGVGDRRRCESVIGRGLVLRGGTRERAVYAVYAVSAMSA